MAQTNVPITPLEDSRLTLVGEIKRWVKVGANVAIVVAPALGYASLTGDINEFEASLLGLVTASSAAVSAAIHLADGIRSR